MLRFLPLLILVSACAEDRPAEADTQASAPAAAQSPMQVTPAAAPMAEGLADIPQDKDQLRRLLAVGYTVHMDHLHKPGVTGCPKMSDDPLR